MRSEKSLILSAPPDEVWAQVTDLAVLAECLPGARLQSLDADGRAHGMISVRVGSIVTNFDGTAEVSHREDDQRVVEVTAEGAGAQGRAQAVVAGRVSPDPAGARLDLTVTVDIAGQLARLGQGMAEPVVDRLVERFGEALTERLSGVPAAGGADAGAPAAASPAAAADDVLDLGSLLPIPPGVRTGAAAAGLVLLVLLIVRLLRRPAPTPTVVVYACGDDRHAPPLPS